MTTVRLNDEIDTKLSVLIDLERKSKSEIIKTAISEYYDNHIISKSPYELGEDLFGKYGGDSNLSEKYKEKLKDKMNAKHAH